MVHHRITIRGDQGNTQSIRGHRLEVDDAVITSVIIQLENKPEDIIVGPGITQRVTNNPLSEVGCTGLSIEFPESTIPNNQSMQAGNHAEHTTHNRLNVDFALGQRTHVMRDLLYLNDIVIPSIYDIKIYYADAPHTLVTQETLNSIRSIQINMRANVRNLIIN